MQCPQCALENRANRKFCAACGHALSIECAQCAFVNEPGDEYCGGCGQRLGASAGQASRALGAAGDLGDVQRQAVMLHKSSPAERRQLTVMFCDLVDSTALSTRLDPEEFRALVRAYQAACQAAVSRFDGYIAQYLGDGLLVYFGHPRAHEDDAQRAVRAGLAMIAAIRDLQSEPAIKLDRPLAIRIGIHTGLVVMGEVGSGERFEQLALGETPNLAAHLQKLADINAVLVSAATYRIVQGFFVTRGPVEYRLKGLAEPVPVYQILQETSVRTRLDVATAAGLTPLVGRDQEVGLLLDRWQQVIDGRGQAVLLTGDAGIGKSRLVQAVVEHVAVESYTRLEFRCSSYYANTPLYPIIDVLGSVLGWRGDDSNPGKLAKLEEFCARNSVSTSEGLPLLASLLSLSVPGYPLPPMSPERQKQRTLETLLSLVYTLAASEPVILIVEDLHWSDPTTLELLTLLIEQASNVRLFALLTARLHFHPPWPARSHFTTLTLDRFTGRQSLLMVKRVAGDKSLPDAVLEEIVSKTDGVPLFVEELTKMVLESGLLRECEDRYELIATLPPLAIPSTLQDSLAARLDRLDTVKLVAQLSATIGRAFPYALLMAVSELDEAIVQRELLRLVDAELLYQRGVPPDALYTFKHALIQEAAYQSLLKSTRQEYHRRIAQVMVERFSAEAQVHPEFVAKHYTEAGLLLESAEWWQRAGQSAVQRAANMEAIAHFTHGLDSAARLPASPKRDQLELGLQLARGYALIPVKGWAAPETARAFTRAGDLCRQINEAPQLFRALWGLGAFHFVRGDQRQARDFADQCLHLAQQGSAVDDLIEAHYLSGMVSCARGGFASGQSDLEESIRLYGPERRQLHTILYGQDPKASSGGWLAMSLWALGRPEQGLLRARDALEFAQGSGHPFALARALAAVGFVHVYRREPQATGGLLQAAIELCREQGFAYFGAVVSAFEGSNLTLLGRTQEGIKMIEDSIATLRAIGSELLFSVIFGHLAQAHLALGRFDDGLAAVAEGLAIVDRNEEHWGEPELHRLKGELLAARHHAQSDSSGADLDQAEASYRLAIATAQSLQARSYELRAATSLVRLRSSQRAIADARGALAAAYASFTEGFDTLDLRDAITMLEAQDNG